MTYGIQPFHLLVIALAGWLNRYQQAVIYYLIEDKRILKDQFERQRLRFTDEQRMRMSVLVQRKFNPMLARQLTGRCLLVGIFNRADASRCPLDGHRSTTKAVDADKLRRC